ncbi:MAG TPA: heptosyltransferase [Chitinophagaceae bacterium]|nr:heptosyltransferase [Chitinophagaceae bacterium]
MQRILVIQTAFIGDVVLATGLLEKLHQHFPDAIIDIAVRKGNESLFIEHPFLQTIHIWDKRKNKYKHLLQLLFSIRKQKYDIVVNVQRYMATGFLTAFSGAKKTIGFDKNPLSFLFTQVIKHDFSGEGDAVHEIQRNHALIRSMTDAQAAKPRLYPSKSDDERVAAYRTQPYICIAPASVWFTKQYPAERWIELIGQLPAVYSIYLLGAPGDKSLCMSIKNQCDREVVNLAGELSFLASAALMKNAAMNYVNDSAPMHFASAVNAPVTAVYCSTVPSFGYGPLSEQSFIVETPVALNCRPCGLHGHAQCPQEHFNCARQIRVEQLLKTLPIT